MEEEMRAFFARAAYYNIKQYQIAQRAGLQPGTISGWNKKGKTPQLESWLRAKAALEEMIAEKTA
jgi:hypothetical protein